MEAILLMIIPFLGYLLAYHTYGKFLSKKIFKLDQAAQVPSRKYEDGKDFVPTKKMVLY